MLIANYFIHRLKIIIYFIQSKRFYHRIIEGSSTARHTLHIEMESLDLIEWQRDECYIIDVIATSNISADNVEMFGFDPIRVIADYIITQLKKLHQASKY